MNPFISFNSNLLPKQRYVSFLLPYADIFQRNTRNFRSYQQSSVSMNSLLCCEQTKEEQKKHESVN